MKSILLSVFLVAIGAGIGEAHQNCLQSTCCAPHGGTGNAAFGFTGCKLTTVQGACCGFHCDSHYFTYYNGRKFCSGSTGVFGCAAGKHLTGLSSGTVTLNDCSGIGNHTGVQYSSTT